MHFILMINLHPTHLNKIFNLITDIIYKKLYYEIYSMP